MTTWVSEEGGAQTLSMCLAWQRPQSARTLSRKLKTPATCFTTGTLRRRTSTSSHSGCHNPGTRLICPAPAAWQGVGRVAAAKHVDDAGEWRSALASSSTRASCATPPTDVTNNSTPQDPTSKPCGNGTRAEVQEFVAPSVRQHWGDGGMHRGNGQSVYGGVVKAPSGGGMGLWWSCNWQMRCTGWGLAQGGGWAEAPHGLGTEYKAMKLTQGPGLKRARGHACAVIPAGNADARECRCHKHSRGGPATSLLHMDVTPGALQEDAAHAPQPRWWLCTPLADSPPCSAPCCIDHERQHACRHVHVANKLLALVALTLQAQGGCKVT